MGKKRLRKPARAQMVLEPLEQANGQPFQMTQRDFEVMNYCAMLLEAVGHASAGNNEQVLKDAAFVYDLSSTVLGTEEGIPVNPDGMLVCWVVVKTVMVSVNYVGSAAPFFKLCPSEHACTFEEIKGLEQKLGDVNRAFGASVRGEPVPGSLKA